MNRVIRAGIGLVVMGCAFACASASAGRAVGGSGSTLTSEQLRTVNSENVYEAIVRLRPEWLTTRGPTSATDMTPTSVDVFMNGTSLGKADYLRNLQAVDITSLRYWDAGQASARFGMGHPRGVIEIIRK